MMTVEQFRQKIRKCIELAQAEGWTIRPRVTLDVERKCCCPIGAWWVVDIGAKGIVGVGHSTVDQTRILIAARAILKLPPGASGAFADGFDGDDSSWGERIREFYELGREFRREFYSFSDD